MASILVRFHTLNLITDKNNNSNIMATQKHHPNTDALRMIMKNPKLSKIVREGLNSPIGSFKRKKANGILNSIGNMHMNRARQDGQGGFWDILSSSASSGKLSFPSLISGIGSAARTIGGSLYNTAKGNLQTLGQFASSVPSSSKQFVTKAILPTAKKMAETGKKGLDYPTDMLASYGSGAETFLTGRPTSETEGGRFLTSRELQRLNEQQARQNAQMATIIPDPLRRSSTQDLSSGPMSMPVGLMSMPAPTIPEAPTAAIMSVAAPTDKYPANFLNWYNKISVNYPEKNTPDAMSAEYARYQSDASHPAKTGVPTYSSTPTPPKGVNAAGLQEMAESDPDAFYNYANQDFSTMGPGSPGSDKKFAGLEQYLLQQAAAGMPADAVKVGIFSDINLLKELIPGVAEEDLPQGALLADQIAGLYTNLKAEYKLDEQLKNLMDMQNTGVALEGNLEDYVRGKDEYLKKVDGMLNDLQDKKVTMDLSNPATAKSMKNYEDYLNILRGRQERRYADFVKLAVFEYDAKLDAAQTNYDMLKENFVTELGLQKDITTERYNLLSGIIENMYNNIANADTIQMEKNQMELDYQTSVLKLIEQQEKILNPSTNLKKADFTLIDELLGGVATKRAIKDATGALILDSKDKVQYEYTGKDYDLYKVLDMAEQFGQDRELVWGRFLNLLNVSSSSLARTGDIRDTINDTNKFIQSLAAHAQSEEDIEDIQSDMNAVTEKALEGMGQGLMVYLENNIDGIKSSLKDLVGGGWRGKPKTEADKQSWINDSQDEVPNKELLSDIFDAYIKNVSLGDVALTDFYNSNMTNDEVKYKIIDYLDNFWRATHDWRTNS